MLDSRVTKCASVHAERGCYSRVMCVKLSHALKRRAACNALHT